MVMNPIMHQVGNLAGSVVDTNYHVVAERTFEDYPRLYRSDVLQSPALVWRGVTWKGDLAVGQVVFWTRERPALDVVVTVDDFSRPDGAVLSGAVALNFLDYTMAGQGNPSLGNPQEPIPDILGDAQSVSIVGIDLRSIWFSVAVPADAAPGAYTTTLTATDREGDDVVFELELEVLDIVFPAKPTRFLDLWQNPYAVARVNGIDTERLWTEAHFAVMRPHYELLRAAGQKVITTTVTRDPWASQTLDAYDSMVAWKRRRGGEFIFDFTVFDAWVQFMMECGIDQQIDAYSMVSWASTITYFDEASRRDIVKKVDPGTREWTQLWSSFLEAFVPHLEENGWLDITFMAMDERALTDILPAVELIAVISDSRLKVTAAMNYNNLNSPDLDRIHNISVLHDRISMESDEFEKIAEHRTSLGLNTTLYNCVGNFPNSFTRSNPAESVWMQWKTVRFKANGYLRWAFDSFTSDPDATGDFGRWESGDAFLVYPYNRSSVRFEKIKEGLRDAEKITYLSSRSLEAAKTLREAMLTMRDEGIAHDMYGGVIDPGIVDFPAEVCRLQSVLLRVTRDFIAEKHATFE